MNEKLYNFKANDERINGKPVPEDEAINNFKRLGDIMENGKYTDTEQAIIEVISEQLMVPVGKITRESSIVDDLDADSLDLVELLMKVEELFACEFEDEAAEKFFTVGDVFDYCAVNSLCVRS